MYVDRGPHANGIHDLASKQQRPVAHILLERIAIETGEEYVPYRPNRYAPPAYGAADGRMMLMTPPALHDAMIRKARARGVPVAAYIREVAGEMLGE